jgi:DNA-binding SARP family transcriptional activator
VFDGELLEGLELIDFDEFTAWCAAEREHARSMHTKVLQSLVDRLGSTPGDALPYARELVRIDPINEEARARLIQLLALAGRRNEAKVQYESAGRMLKELGARATGPLETAWREANRWTEHPEEAPAAPSATPTVASTQPSARDATSPRSRDVFVGRQEERSCFRSWMTQARDA